MIERATTSEELLWKHVTCPVDTLPIHRTGDEVVCGEGHTYPVVRGIPVMVVPDVAQTHNAATETLQQARGEPAPEPEPLPNGIDPVVNELVGATCGYLYNPLIGRLQRYPIPSLRLPPGDGRTLLDVGCNWGRWTISAARSGYRAVGIDPNLTALLAARRVARQLGVDAAFVAGDARYLPFRTGSLDTVFSYSVIQHFSKEDARSALAEAGRVLAPGGTSLIQMPNRWGIRSLYHQARRRFAPGGGFDVRYWTVPELLRAFETAIGPSRISVDGYFGLGIQSADVDMLPPRYAAIVRASELLRGLSTRLPWMAHAADSLYVTSVKATA